MLWRMPELALHLELQGFLTEQRNWSMNGLALSHKFKNPKEYTNVLNLIVFHK